MKFVNALYCMARHISCLYTFNFFFFYSWSFCFNKILLDVATVQATVTHSPKDIWGHGHVQCLFTCCHWHKGQVGSATQVHFTEENKIIFLDSYYYCLVSFYFINLNTPKSVYMSLWLISWKCIVNLESSAWHCHPLLIWFLWWPLKVTTFRKIEYACTNLITHNMEVSCSTVGTWVW